jgi:hypothetical protein
MSVLGSTKEWRHDCIIGKRNTKDNVIPKRWGMKYPIWALGIMRKHATSLVRELPFDYIRIDIE